MSRALVTGASGFIGSHLCRRLLESGTELHAVSRYEHERNQARWWQADLTDPGATTRLVEHVRPDTIYHLAGYVSGSRSLDTVGPSFRHNLGAAVNILTAAARVGCVAVLAGSMEEPAPSGEEPVPASPYAAAKHAASSYGRMLHALHDLPVVNLRVFMVYGPGQTDHTKLIPYVITSLLQGQRPRLTSGVRAIDWVFVDDVVDAFVAAARVPGVAGESIDIGSGKLVTIGSIVQQIVEIMGSGLRPELGEVPDRPLEVVRIADIERTRAVLGWQPQTNLSEGLRATVESFAAERPSTSSMAREGT